MIAGVQGTFQLPTAEVAELFDRLCDLPIDRQRVMLAGLDEGLRAQLVALLEADATFTQPVDGDPGSGAVASSLADALDPEEVAGFTVIRRLGAGGMGRVYAARQVHPARTVALKLLAPSLRGTEAEEFFRFEAQALSQVRHAGVPPIYEAGSSVHGPYLAMELVGGAPLLEATADLSRAERLSLGIAIVDAVCAVHRAGVLHRDLKPDNILVDAGQPKLLDFGIAAPLDHPARRHPGTPAYMAPEQRRGERLTEAADVFALGVLLWRMLEGALPSRGARPQDDLTEVLARALEPDLDRRFATASELRERLRDVEAGRALPWHSVRQGLIRQLRRHRRGVGLVLGGVASVLLALATWALYTSAERAEREAAVTLRWEALRPRIQQALDTGDVASARAALDAFVRDPSLGGSSVAVDAWLTWGTWRLGDGDPDGAIEAFAEAYVRSPSADQTRRAVLGLARAFDGSGRHDSLLALGRTYPGIVRSGAPLEWVRAHTRARLLDLEVPAVVASVAPLVEFLERQTHHGLPEAATSGVFDLDGDGRGELLRGEGSSIGVYGWDGELVLRERWRVPGARQVRDLVASEDGTVYLVADTTAGQRLFSRAPGAELEVLERYAPGMDVGVSAAPDGVYVRYFGQRREAVLWRDGSPTPLPEVRGDPMAARTVDVDGDGSMETVLVTGPWNGYALAVYGMDGPEPVLRDEVQLAALSDVWPIPRPDGRHWLAVTAGHHFQDIETFGETHPSGEEAGIHVFAFEEEDLTRVHHIPLPHTGAHAIEKLLGVAGPVSFVAGQHSEGRAASFWPVLDTASAAHVELDAVRPIAAGDLDGDGQDELVGEADGQVVVFGLGSDRLEPLGGLVVRELGPAPDGLDSFGRLHWERAGELLALGLVPETARLLDARARLAPPEIQGPLFEAAIPLHLEGGDLEAAEAGLVRIAERPAMARELAALRVRLGRAGAARDALVAVGEPVPFDVPTRVALLGPDLAGWDLGAAGLFASLGDGVWIDATAERRILAERAVRVTRPPSLDLRIDLRDPEIGTGLFVSLVDASGRSWLHTGVELRGGHGMYMTGLRCGSDSGAPVTPFVMSTRSERQVQVRVGFDALGAPRCALSLDDETRRPTLDAGIPPPGEYRVVLEALSGVYHPSQRFRGGVELGGTGLEPLPGRDLPDLHARRRLALGDASPPAASEEGIWWALARDDSAAIRRELRRFGDPERAELLWSLLRRQPEATVGAWRALVPTARFSRDVGEAWAEAARQYPDREAVGRVLALEAFGAVEPVTPEAAMVLAGRAWSLWRRGHLSRAEAVARRVLDEGPADALRARERAALTLALSQAGRDRTAAREAFVELTAVARSPAWLVQTQRRWPALAALGGIPTPGAAP